jgi:hypothetical protein
MFGLLVEIHTEHHHKWAMRYNYDLSTARTNPLVKLKTNVTGNVFSLFEDPNKRNDTVPSGRYLSEVRKQHHKTAHLPLTREVKTIPTDTLVMDVLYKVENSLCCYREQPLFKGSVSGLDPASRV